MPEGWFLHKFPRCLRLDLSWVSSASHSACGFRSAGALGRVQDSGVCKVCGSVTLRLHRRDVSVRRSGYTNPGMSVTGSVPHQCQQTECVNTSLLSSHSVLCLVTEWPSVPAPGLPATWPKHSRWGKILILSRRLPLRWAEATLVSCTSCPFSHQCLCDSLPWGSPNTLSTQEWPRCPLRPILSVVHGQRLFPGH